MMNQSEPLSLDSCNLLIYYLGEDRDGVVIWALKRWRRESSNFCLESCANCGIGLQSFYKKTLIFSFQKFGTLGFRYFWCCYLYAQHVRSKQLLLCMNVNGGHVLELSIILHKMCVSYPTRSGCRAKNIKSICLTPNYLTSFKYLGKCAFCLLTVGPESISPPDQLS